MHGLKKNSESAVGGQCHLVVRRKKKIGAHRLGRENVTKNDVADLRRCKDLFLVKQINHRLKENKERI